MKKYKIEYNNSCKKEHLAKKYKLDLNQYKEKHGFGLSKLEINETHQHIQALEDFMASKENYALIYSTLQNPNVIHDFDISEDDWNFITLQPETKSKYVPQQGYRLGYKWADMNYLVSREGATVILDRIRDIDQTYCDIILGLILDGKLSSFSFEDDRFGFDIKVPTYNENRNQEILLTILSKNRWNTHDKRKIRELMQITFQESKELGIDIFINEGTLLGCIRHGKIMDWDDDLDIAIDSRNVKVFLDKLKQNKNIEIGTAHLYGKHLFYKIWLKDCKEIRGHKHRFPFIDIWPFEIIESQLKYDFGYSYPSEDIFPLQEIEFEETFVKVPKNSLLYLNIRYPGWKNKVVFYPYCHQIERTTEKLLEAYIRVDDKGFIKYNNSIRSSEY